MKRWVMLSFIILLAAGALVLAEFQKPDGRATPAAVLRWLADVGYELTRVPVSTARLSDAEEIQIGNRLAKRFSTRFAVTGPGDQEIAAYVQGVGARVAAHAHRKLPYRFLYIPDANYINAFALPGGYVFIGKGLITIIHSEDELACILGHEIEHIDHYDCAERVQEEAALEKIPLGDLIGIPIEVLEAGYSKKQELDADLDGTRLAARAGYSPLAAIHILERLREFYNHQIESPRTIREELSQVAIQTLTGYFASHPPTPIRIAQIRGMITEEHLSTSVAERKLAVEEILAPHTTKSSAKLPRG